MPKIKTAKEYAESHDGEWRSVEDFSLYANICLRFQVFVESSYHDFSGIDRDEDLANQGIYGPDFDAEEFSRDFIQKFCNHLSRHELDILIANLIKYREDIREITGR